MHQPINVHNFVMTYSLNQLIKHFKIEDINILKLAIIIFCRTLPTNLMDNYTIIDNK